MTTKLHQAISVTPDPNSTPLPVLYAALMCVCVRCVLVPTVLQSCDVSCSVSIQAVPYIAAVVVRLIS